MRRLILPILLGVIATGCGKSDALVYGPNLIHSAMQKWPDQDEAWEDVYSVLLKRGQEISRAIAGRHEAASRDFRAGYQQVVQAVLLWDPVDYFADDSIEEFKRGMAAAEKEIREIDPHYLDLHDQYMDHPPK